MLCLPKDAELKLSVELPGYVLAPVRAGEIGQLLFEAALAPKIAVEGHHVGLQVVFHAVVDVALHVRRNVGDHEAVLV